MKRITSYIPNTITCGNLLAGSLAAIMALQGDFESTAILILFAAVCDFLDGLSARLLHAYSPMGKELDSLADLISFGLVPGLMVYKYLYVHRTYDDVPIIKYDDVPIYIDILPYVALLIPVAAGLRLAKFNVDDRQSTSFIGLPVPANALFWIGICLSYIPPFSELEIVAFVLLFSYLMVSNLPMFSLKVSNLTWRDNKLRYILVAISLALIIWHGFVGLAGAVIVYILLSLIALVGKK